MNDQITALRAGELIDALFELRDIDDPIGQSIISLLANAGIHVYEIPKEQA